MAVKYWQGVIDSQGYLSGSEHELVKTVVYQLLAGHTKSADMDLKRSGKGKAKIKV